MRRVLSMVCALTTCAGVAQAAPLPPSGTLDLKDGADAVLAGEADGDWAGWAVSSAGDVNGDGQADALVAAPKADPHGREDAGTVYVVFGPLAAGKLGERPGFRIDGANPGDRAGTAVAAAGDVNGDGLGDVLVGAPHVPDSGAEGSGTAYLVLGRAAAAPVDLSDAAAARRFTTGAAGDQTGVAVGAAPDMDG